MKMKENLTFKIAAISAILLAIFAMPLVGVKGEPSTPVSGTWIPLPPLEFTNWKFVGGNIECDAPSMNGKFTYGPITGDFIQSLHICYHYGDPKLVKQLKSQPPSAWPDTSFSFTHFVRVVGTEKDPAIVLGRSGTFEMRLEWHGYGNSFKGWAGFDIEGTWVIIHGTGGLAGLHGQGTVKHTRDGPLCFEYEGQVHFDP